MSSSEPLLDAAGWSPSVAGDHPWFACRDSPEPNPSSISTKYQQVTVDVPEDRIGEFHAFFGRFLAGRSGRGPRGRYGRPHRSAHGRGCAARREATARGEATEQPAGTSEV
jgi:hypothetical protein